MKTTSQYSSEILTAYLDGELDAELTKNISTQATSNPLLKQRILALEVEKKAIAASFEKLLSHSPDVPDFLVTDEQTDQSFLPQAARFAAACVLCMLVGGFFGYTYSQSQNEGWRQYVATYQALYVQQTLEHIQITQEASISELERVSQVVGKQIPYSLVTNQEGYQYKRAQILGYRGRALAPTHFRR